MRSRPNPSLTGHGISRVDFAALVALVASALSSAPLSKVRPGHYRGRGDTTKGAFGKPNGKRLARWCGYRAERMAP